MKKTFWTKLTSMVLCLCMTLPLFAACGSRKDDESGSEQEDAEREAYYAAQTLDWNQSGKYSGVFSLLPEQNDEFIDFSTTDFEMVADKTIDSENISVSINDFSVKKNSATELAYSFSTPMIYDNGFSYRITSTKSVTKNDYPVSMELKITKEAIALSTTCTGAYVGSDGIKIDAKINSDSGVNAKFQSVITSDMFRFPNGVDGTVTITETSETEIKFEITDLTENLALDTLVVEIDERAFDCAFAESVYVTINYVNPKIDTDESSIVIDRENNKLTIGKMYLPSGAKGSQNGILANKNYFEIASQSYNADENYYSVELTVKPSEEKDYDAIIKDLELCCVLLVGEEKEVVYSMVRPTYAECEILSEVELDKDNETFKIILTAKNGKFASGLTIADFTVSPTEQLTNLKLISADTDTVVLSADYNEDFTYGTVFSILLASGKIIGEYDAESNIAFVYVPSYVTDRIDVDYYDFAGKLDKLPDSLLDGVTSGLGSAAVEILLPYVYDFLGIDTTSEETKQILGQISAVQSAINDLSIDISYATELIRKTSNELQLTSFWEKERSLLYTSTTAFSSANVIAYAKYDGNHDGKIAELKKDRNFEEFYSYVQSVESNMTDVDEWFNPDNPTKDEWKNIYNDFIDAVLNKGYSESQIKYKISDRLKDYRSYDYWDSFYYYDDPAYDTNRIYEYVKNATSIYTGGKTEYTDDQIAKIKEGFISEIEKIGKYNYVNDVLLYGDLLYPVDPGLTEKDSAISRFFDTVDMTYNFESETIKAKEAFLSRSVNVYILNASLALKYCTETENANYTRLETQYKNVLKLFQKKKEEINAAKARQAAGKDVILLTGQTVSKQMKVLDISNATYNGHNEDDTKKTFNSMISISAETYAKMMKRAEAMGYSLADELNKAGFNGVTANKADSKSYVYYCGGISSNYHEAATGTQMKECFSKCWYNGETYIWVNDVEANLARQTGNGRCETLNGSNIIKAYWMFTFWGKKYRWKYERSYNTIIGFVAG